MSERKPQFSKTPNTRWMSNLPNHPHSTSPLFPLAGEGISINSAHARTNANASTHNTTLCRPPPAPPITSHQCGPCFLLQRACVNCPFFPQTHAGARGQAGVHRCTPESAKEKQRPRFRHAFRRRHAAGGMRRTLRTRKPHMAYAQLHFVQAGRGCCQAPMA